LGIGWENIKEMLSKGEYEVWNTTINPPIRVKLCEVDCNAQGKGGEGVEGNGQGKEVENRSVPLTGDSAWSQTLHTLSLYPSCNLVFSTPSLGPPSAKGWSGMSDVAEITEGKGRTHEGGYEGWKGGMEAR